MLLPLLAVRYVSASGATETATISSGSHYYSISIYNDAVDLRLTYSPASNTQPSIQLSIRAYTSDGKLVGSSSASNLHLDINPVAKYYVEVAYMSGSVPVDYTLEIDAGGKLIIYDDLGTDTPSGLPPPPAAPFNALMLIPIIGIPLLLVICIIVARRKRPVAESAMVVPPTNVTFEPAPTALYASEVAERTRQSAQHALCEYCGAQIGAGAKFCPRCGTSLV